MKAGHARDKTMKQILLVINGESATNSSFQYAVDLCKKIKAELSILQFVNKKSVERCITETSKGIKAVGKRLENTFAAAAFMEEGDNDTANQILSSPTPSVMELLPKSKKAGVPVRVSLSDNAPEKELPIYIDNHQDIVLTIYDSSPGQASSASRGKDPLKRIKNRLPVPLVVIKN